MNCKPNFVMICFLNMEKRDLAWENKALVLLFVIGMKAMHGSKQKRVDNYHLAILVRKCREVSINHTNEILQFRTRFALEFEDVAFRFSQKLSFEIYNRF